MIGCIKGKIIHKGLDWVLIDVSGVGYKIFVLPKERENKTDSPVTFYTHTYVREDTLALYGFSDIKELELFELLISVSGIGPRAALGILSVGDAETIKKAIAEGRSDILKSVPGVGKKIADRAILELQGKISSTGEGNLPKLMSKEDEQASQALVNLGYKTGEAKEIMAKVSQEEGLTVEEKIKKALSLIGK